GPPVERVFRAGEDATGGTRPAAARSSKGARGRGREAALRGRRRRSRRQHARRVRRPLPRRNAEMGGCSEAVGGGARLARESGRTGGRESDTTWFSIGRSRDSATSRFPPR